MPVPAPSTPRIDPAAYATFRFGAVEIDEAAAEVRLHYALEAGPGGDSEAARPLAFVETVAFEDVAWPAEGPRREALHRLAHLLHLLAGTSYFKVAAPGAILVDGEDARGPELAALLREVYTQGLGEFGYRNGIDPRRRGAWPPTPTETPPAPPALEPTGRTLVPVGGGKDSPVALEVVRAAGREVVAFSVGSATPIVGEVAAAGVPHAIARRTLDPQLGALNEAGALNGHVPVTAVVSTIALMAAVLHGCDGVAMANERSASEANLLWDGLPVNHQWSKSAEFERRLRQVLAAEVATGLDYRSVLRPAGELAIARAFAALPAYHPVFTSCNRVFRLDPARRYGHWCGECDKCRFVALALAPYLAPEALRAIFRRDLLDEPAQLDGFLDLAGLREHKPFECVGEEAESLAAMRLVADRPDYAGQSVVRALAEGPLAELPAGQPDVDGPLRLDERALDELPADLAEAVRDFLS